MMLVGSVAAALSPQLNMPAAVAAAADSIWPGGGTVLLLAALLGLFTISALNFYGASLTLLSVADSIRPIAHTVANRVKSILLAVVVAVMIALASSDDFAHRFNDLLALLLYLFTPWTAINLVDFYVVRKVTIQSGKFSTPPACTAVELARLGGLRRWIRGHDSFFQCGQFMGPLPARSGVRTSRCWWGCPSPRVFISSRTARSTSGATTGSPYWRIKASSPTHDAGGGKVELTAAD